MNADPYGLLRDRERVQEKERFCLIDLRSGRNDRDRIEAVGDEDQSEDISKLTGIDALFTTRLACHGQGPLGLLRALGRVYVGPLGGGESVIEGGSSKVTRVRV